MTMNPTRTTLRQALPRWQRGIVRAVLLLGALAGSLSGFTVTVTCAQTADTTEGNRKVRVFQIVATACNQGASCPAATPTNGYVERQVQASLAKCKDLTAQWPRCACG